MPCTPEDDGSPLLQPVIALCTLDENLAEGLGRQTHMLDHVCSVGESILAGIIGRPKDILTLDAVHP